MLSLMPDQHFVLFYNFYPGYLVIFVIIASPPEFFPGEQSILYTSVHPQGSELWDARRFME